jgi:hypothetical protein
VPGCVFTWGSILRFKNKNTRALNFEIFFFVRMRGYERYRSISRSRLRPGGGGGRDLAFVTLPVSNRRLLVVSRGVI